MKDNSKNTIFNKKQIFQKYARKSIKDIITLSIICFKLSFPFAIEH